MDAFKYQIDTPKVIEWFPIYIKCYHKIFYYQSYASKTYIYAIFNKMKSYCNIIPKTNKFFKLTWKQFKYICGKYTAWLEYQIDESDVQMSTRLISEWNLTWKLKTDYHYVFLYENATFIVECAIKLRPVWIPIKHKRAQTNIDFSLAFTAMIIPF